jgi:hypothetical protein
MVLANKYDAFRERERYARTATTEQRLRRRSEYRKLMGRALRYVTHIYGASLYYTTQADRADEKLASRVRVASCSSAGR